MQSKFSKVNCFELAVYKKKKVTDVSYSSSFVVGVKFLRENTWLLMLTILFLARHQSADKIRPSRKS